MLAHWGASAAYMCTPEANFGAPPRKMFLIQLEEARRVAAKVPQGFTAWR